jgi:hypothetical protein
MRALGEVAARHDSLAHCGPMTGARHVHDAKLCLHNSGQLICEFLMRLHCKHGNVYHLAPFDNGFIVLACAKLLGLPCESVGVSVSIHSSLQAVFYEPGGV